MWIWPAKGPGFSPTVGILFCSSAAGPGTAKRLQVVVFGGCLGRPALLLL